MLLNDVHFDLAQQRRTRELAEAARARLLERKPRSVRRSVGLSIMKIGARLASEPQPRLARSL